MNDLRPLSYGIITALYTIATITIIMRIYIRWYTMNIFSWDDWAMSIMLIFNSCQQAILYLFLQYGAGLPIAQVMDSHPEWLPTILKGLLLEEFWYTLMQFTVKMCFLLFYFRLSDVPWFRRTVWAVIAFNLVTTAVIWLLYAFQCIPLAVFYEPASRVGAKCLPGKVTYFIPYTLNMTTDIFILLLPLPTILSLRVPLRRRLAVLGVITTGGAAMLVSGLRVVVLTEFAVTRDLTWALGKMVIFTSAEMQVAILAANMPSLKAFYSCWKLHKLGRGQAADLAYDGGGGGNSSRGRANMQHTMSSSSSRRVEDIELGRGSMHVVPSTARSSRSRQVVGLTLERESQEKLWRKSNGYIEMRGWHGR